MTERLYGTLSENVVAFGRRLRTEGVGVGPADPLAAVNALAATDLSRPDTFRFCLRITLAKSRREKVIFDRCFDAFWSIWERVDLASTPSEKRAPGASSRPGAPAVISLRNWLTRCDASEEPHEVAFYSPVESFGRRDFSDLSAAEVDKMTVVLRNVARALAGRAARRYRQNASRGPLDLRRTLRRNLKQGGEMVDLVRRSRRPRPMKVVLLCDVSRSMEIYSRFFIAFMTAFQRALPRMETFVFSTSLHRITTVLRGESGESVSHILGEAAPTWSGGTRIGVSLREFLDRYGARMLSRHTVVFIVSDGWDTGEIDQVESSMREIHARARSIIWLNALLGNPNYEPASRGMQAALPYIDIFAPAHNLESLRRLANTLSTRTLHKRKLISQG
jgi:uncharacterized protein with von Willebrand factor type A (vWA) domain